MGPLEGGARALGVMLVIDGHQRVRLDDGLEIPAQRVHALTGGTTFGQKPPPYVFTLGRKVRVATGLLVHPLHNTGPGAPIPPAPRLSPQIAGRHRTTKAPTVVVGAFVRRTGGRGRFRTADICFVRAALYP